MSNTTIIDWKTFNFDNIKFGAVTKNKSSGQSTVAIQYVQDGVTLDSIYIQTPKLRSPFGFSRKTFPDGGEQVTMPVALDQSEEASKFHAFVQRLEDRIKAEAKASQKAWWPKDKKPLSDDLLEDRFTSVIKDEHDTYDPYIKVKVPTSKAGNVITAFFNTAGNRIDAEQVTAGCTVSQLIQVNSVWFMNGGFGSGFRSFQVVNYGGGSAFGDQLAIKIEVDEGDEPPAKRLQMTVGE